LQSSDRYVGFPTASLKEMMGTRTGHSEGGCVEGGCV